MAFSKHCRFVFKFVTSGHFSKQSQTVCYDGWAGVRKAVTPHLLSLYRFLPPFKNALHRSQVCVNIRLPLLELKWFGYECICTRISIDTHTYIHIYIYTYKYVYSNMYTYMYICIHIYTHMRGCATRPPRRRLASGMQRRVFLSKWVPVLPPVASPPHAFQLSEPLSQTRRCSNVRSWQQQRLPPRTLGSGRGLPKAEALIHAGALRKSQPILA